VLPCLALAFDSWAFVAAAIAIGIGVRPGASREERDLEEEFGDAWRAYHTAPACSCLAGCRRTGPRFLKTIVVRQRRGMAVAATSRAVALLGTTHRTQGRHAG
jgi:hypothetical protein